MGESHTNQFAKPVRKKRMNPGFSTEIENKKQSEYRSPYPNLLYPTDMESRRHTINKNSNRPDSYSFNSSYPSRGYDRTREFDRYVEENNQQVEIRYIPVPVYRVPGTLPGTVPGVITPANMVPGYSHLSPNYQRGDTFSDIQRQPLSYSSRLNRRSSTKNNIRSFMGTGYNPLSGMGVFPGGSNPFDSFYKSYETPSQSLTPFISPTTSIPGFSLPNLFSSQ